MPIRRVRSASSTFWALTSVTRSWRSGTRPRGRWREPRAVRGAGCVHARCGGGGVRGRAAQLRRGDARSSRLAHHLRALGVGPEVVVGLCIERSLAMLVGLVGILKAGRIIRIICPSGSRSCWRMPAKEPASPGAHEPRGSLDGRGRSRHAVGAHAIEFFANASMSACHPSELLETHSIFFQARRSMTKGRDPSDAGPQAA